jgi:cell wall-associated NlpC family hydrolase
MARTRSRPWFDPRRWFRSSASFVERITGRVRRRAVLARMKEGDIVLASPRLVRLSPIALAYRLLLGSRYVHSMLYVGSDRMIHTTTRHGVVMGRIPRKLFDRERYAIYRVPGLTDAERAKVVDRAVASLERELDPVALAANIPARWFRLREPVARIEKNRVWCSKLIAEAYREGAGVEIVPRDAEGTVMTEDFAKSPVLERV